MAKVPAKIPFKQATHEKTGHSSVKTPAKAPFQQPKPGGNLGKAMPKIKAAGPVAPKAGPGKEAKVSKPAKMKSTDDIRKYAKKKYG